MGTDTETALKIINCQIDRIEGILNELQSRERQYRFRLAEERALNPALRARQEAEFNERAQEVYRRYREYRNAGLRHTEALKATRLKLELKYDVAEFYIKEGRRLKYPESF